MSATILGGAIGQWPFGRLSDRMDRRLVLVSACVIAAACGLSIYLLGVLWGTYHKGTLLALACLWGAAAFPLYAISIAHANDHAAPEEFVEVSSGMLLVYAAGSVVGPLLASIVMDRMGSSSLYAFTALVHVLLAGYAAWRVKQRTAPPAEEQITFKQALAAAQTTSETFDAEIQRKQIARSGEIKDPPRQTDPPTGSRASKFEGKN